METRRNFLGKISGGIALGFLSNTVFGAVNGPIEVNVDEPVLSITNSKKAFAPLEKIKINCKNTSGSIEVWDSKGNLYVNMLLSDKKDIFAGGYGGTQFIIYKDEENIIKDILPFEVIVQTEIEDKNGVYKILLDVCKWTMFDWLNGHNRSFVRYNGKLYENFMDWVRDLVWNQWGMQYFYKEIKQGVDLFVYSQREDGMIWDNYKHKRGSS
jgi:hypothetical protein